MRDNTAYQVRINFDQTALQPFAPTKPGVGSNNTIDSDGVPNFSTRLVVATGKFLLYFYICIFFHF